MKKYLCLVFMTIVFVISSIATSLAQPSQLAKAVNFRNNYIPIEIQDGFILDSVFCNYSTPSSFKSFHFKYNSSGQLIWEDDLGAVVLISTIYDSISHRPIQVMKYYQTFSNNSYNEKGLLSLQSMHFIDTVLNNVGSRTYSYDSNDRIVSIINVTENNDTENSDTTTYTKYQYNSSGNLTLYYWGDNWGYIVTDSSIMKYDSLGRIKSRLDPLNGIGYFYEYNSIGNETCTISHVINQSIIDTVEMHHFEYDGADCKLLDIWNSGTTDSLFYDKVSFTYDGSGKLLSIVDSNYAYYESTLLGRYPYIFSYNSDNNLDSCVSGWQIGFGSFKPNGILLYDHYGNAFYRWFESVNNSKIFPYYSKLSSVGVTNSNNAPRDFYLYQNYPNPFNPSTEISYTISKAGKVTLKVYNLLGQEVATLVNGYQTANTYKVNFNASGLSSGVYFYKLSSGNNEIVRKMVLMK